MKSLTHESLTRVFTQFRNDAGALPKRLYTDFDDKIISGPTAQFLGENHCDVRAAPGGRQNQNGLVERAWQTIVAMALSYITDMQMPRNFWYCA